MALENISVEINHGETVGIIGSTGSGKSTFINLIPRFYDATEGEVRMEGVNVKNYSLTQLRRKVGMVPQKSILFTGTIAENIRWGNEDATDPVISMAISRDGGRTFGDERWRPIGAEGEYGRRAIWRRNGRSGRFDVYRFTLSDPVKPAIIQLTADLQGGYSATA